MGTRISQFTPLTTVASADYFPLVQDSDTTNKRVSLASLLASVPLGSAATPSIAFTGDLNTGIYSPGADQVAVATNGVGRLFVDASGNVKITSSQYQAIAHKNISGYAIYGAVVIGSGSGSQGNISLGFDVSTTTGLNFNGTAQTYFHPNGALIPNNAGTNYIGLFARDSSDSILLGPATSSGKASGPLTLTSTSVGIGTSSPNATLHVVGSSGSGSVQIGNAANTQYHYINFGGSSSIDDAWQLGRSPSGGVGPANGFYLYDLKNSETRLAVDTSGNVGIGTTSPGAPLEVIGTAGTISARATTGVSSQALQIYNNGTDSYIDSTAYGAGSGGGIAFRRNGTGEMGRFDSSGRLLVGTSTSPSAGEGQYARIVAQGYTGLASGAGYISLQRGEASTAISADEELGLINFGDSSGNTFATISCKADANAGAGDYPGRLTFSTTADGASSPTERMRITSGSVNGANFLFNCTSFPSASVKGIGIAPNSSFGNYIGCGTSSTGNYEHFEFFNPNGLVGSIKTNGSATSYNTSSDYRLKENVAPVTDGIARLQQLKPSRFNFIADPDTTFDGFIAHEAQAIVPECVTGEKDAVDDDGNPKHQGIDQSKLVPLLTAALQEAIAKIESLEARLTAAGI